MRLRLTVPPGTASLSVDQVQQHLRVDPGIDEGLIHTLIDVASNMAEHETGRRLISQVWTVTVQNGERFSLDGLTPLQACELVRASGTVEPVELGYPDTAHAVAPVAGDLRIRCGYGEPGDIPPAIRHWMLLQIGTWYTHREALVSGTGSLHSLPRNHVDALLDPYRLTRI